MNFETSFAKQLNIYNDLLLDILAWQVTIVELKAEKLAESNNITIEEAMGTLSKIKSTHRERFMEEIYTKYSNLPDSINDLLNYNEDGL